MGADSGKGHLIDPQFLGQIRQEAPPQRAGGLHRGEDPPGQAHGIDGLPIPVAGGGIIEHGGGRDGILGLFLAGEEIAQEVRHQEHGLRLLQGHIALRLAAAELIEGVEVHGGNAGAGEERLKGDGLPNPLHVGIHRVAVRAGVAQQAAVAVQKAVVHAPGVDAEAVQLPQLGSAEGMEALLHLLVEVEAVPVQHAAQAYIVVFIAVQLFHGDFFAVKPAQNGPAIAGAQVEG